MPRRVNLPHAELCARYAAGESTGALARSYGCCPATIANRLRACGVALRSSRFRPAALSEAELRRLYLSERLPIRAIAAHFGVSTSTIGNRRRGYNIPARARH